MRRTTSWSRSRVGGRGTSPAVGRCGATLDHSPKAGARASSAQGFSLPRPPRGQSCGEIKIHTTQSQRRRRRGPVLRAIPRSVSPASSSSQPRDQHRVGSHGRGQGVWVACLRARSVRRGAIRALVVRRAGVAGPRPRPGRGLGGFGRDRLGHSGLPSHSQPAHVPVRALILASRPSGMGSCRNPTRSGPQWL
jgi:hypothetical protein